MVGRHHAAPGVLIVVALALSIGACTSAESTTTTTPAVTTIGSTPSTSGLAPVTTSGPAATAEVDSAPTRVLSGEMDFPDGFVVPAGETWEFDPGHDVTVTSEANVVVEGTLVMRPSSGDIEHVLQFEDIDESAFQGGGMEPVPTDVGLWVVGDGRLVAEGAEKPAWGYEFDASWVGDEVVAAPNTAGEYEKFGPVSATPPPNSLGYPTELLDLTRNVRIEGTPNGYTHVFIHSTRPQTIRYVAIRYVASGFDQDTDQTGRYGLHFHHAGDGSRGSLVEGVVVRDAGNHAFVPHASNGITFRDTIAYHVQNEAYWWDPPEEPDSTVNDTHDLVWDRVIAAGVGLGAGGSEYRLSAFFLGNGTNMALTNSVAVGVEGKDESSRSGFTWPEAAKSAWTFESNIAHNNDADGIFVWQNNSIRHDVVGFTAYYNTLAGVEHGAYSNSYQYTDLTLLDNGVAVRSHALGKPTDGADTQTWSGLRTDGGTLVVDEHATAGETPVRFLSCDLSKVVVADGGGDSPGDFDFVGCGLTPDDFDLSRAKGDSVFRVQSSDGSAYQLTGGGKVTDIDPFYAGP